MPHAMTEDHSHDDAEGQYRVPMALTGAAARKHDADAELRLVKPTDDAPPGAARRSGEPIKRTK